MHPDLVEGWVFCRRAFDAARIADFWPLPEHEPFFRTLVRAHERLEGGRSGGAGTRHSSRAGTGVAFRRGGGLRLSARGHAAPSLRAALPLRKRLQSREKRRHRRHRKRGQQQPARRPQVDDLLGDRADREQR